MIDNYDSFTYNLVQYFMQLGEEVKVFRNDELTVKQAEELEFDYLVISPGPGTPKDSGCSLDMVGAFAGRKPILGVCLGHQSIGEVFGGKVVQAHSIMHGKSDMINHDGKSNNSSEGATLYITDSPCMDCAKLIIQAGIARVVYGDQYRITDGIKLLEKAGIEIIKISDVPGT